MATIVFFGTSEFAVPSLRALASDSRFKIKAVVTQPDRPVGRHAVMTAPPIKQEAKSLNLSIFQPERLEELKTENIEADLFVVVSYGKILPQWLLDIPKHGCVNVHGSLLPRWRGASPIQSAIAAGDSATGVTIMQMDAGLDHGPILAIKEETIRSDDTAGSLHDRLATLGASLLPDTLSGFLDGSISPIPQDDSQATFCRTLKRDDGKLDPISKNAEELERLVRGYYPWPGTWIEHDGKRIKILDARHGASTQHSAGEIFVLDKHLFLACADGTSLELVTIQREGKKPVTNPATL
jgi:methionyl-tRNA formyltransferase